MPNLNLTQAAHAVSKSRQTLYQHLKAGKVSATTDRDGNRVIHTSELIRVYGELKNQPTDSPDTSTDCPTGQRLTPPSDTTDTVVKLLEEQVKELKSQLTIVEAEKTRMLDDATREKDRLLSLLEKQTILLTDQRQQPRSGFFAKIFGLAA